MIVGTGTDDSAIMNDDDAIVLVGEVLQGDFTAGVVTRAEAIDPDEYGVLYRPGWLERWKTIIFHGIFRLLVEIRNLGV